MSDALDVALTMTPVVALSTRLRDGLVSLCCLSVDFRLCFRVLVTPRAPAPRPPRPFAANRDALTFWALLAWFGVGACSPWFEASVARSRWSHVRSLAFVEQSLAARARGLGVGIVGMCWFLVCFLAQHAASRAAGCGAVVAVAQQ